VAQHFLLSKAARSLSLAKVARMSDDEAWGTFKAIRWAETDGEPFCPRCGCLKHSFIATRKLFKCAGCRHQYSATSGTIFASRKLPIRDHLLAIAIFANGAKGHSALQLSRDLNCQYRTAFVMAHKLREAVAAETAEATVSGTVEVDGAYFGGHVRPENMKADRRDRRLAENQTGKRRVVVVIRERQGKTLTFAFRTEAESVETIEARVAAGSTVHADEAKGWDRLHKTFTTHRINHQQAYSDGGACTNQAESYFARLRRAEKGVYHRIAGPYLVSYAREMAWRENYRRVSNGDQYAMIAGASLRHPPSAAWKGYWQRHQLPKGAA